MKSLKKYAIISLGGLAILALGGCQTNNQIQQQNQQDLINQAEKETVSADPMADVKEVTGNDTASKTINEIDGLLNDSDADDMSGDALTDKNLGL